MNEARRSNGAELTRLALIVAACFMALLLAASAGHCESLVSVGASMVSSSGLGYESPYAGARIEASTERGGFVSRALLAGYDAQKIDRSGYGLRAELFAGWRFADWAVLSVGGRYVDQVSDGRHKSGLAPAIELEFRGDHLALRIGAERLDEPDDRQDVTSLEIRTRGRWRVFGRYERIEFESRFADGTGERVEAGLLYQVNRR